MTNAECPICSQQAPTMNWAEVTEIVLDTLFGAALACLLFIGIGLLLIEVLIFS